MPPISYSVDGFPPVLPNGFRSPTGGLKHVAPARLVWAATTIGTVPFGPRLRSSRSLELQWRQAMVRASLTTAAVKYVRSDSYKRLDPSEKGAVSFFLGQAQAKLFAHELFHISRFVHYDSYLTHIGLPRRHTRPDFAGFHASRGAILVEAKGRSNGFGPELITSAKHQLSGIPNISGYSTIAAYVHVAYFHQNEWRGYLYDPPNQATVNPIDPGLLTLSYYQPIVDSFAQRESTEIRLQDDQLYRRTYLEQTDTYLSVRSDIFDLVVSSPPNLREQSQKIVDALNGLAIEMDESPIDPAVLDVKEHSSYLGGDGIEVILGTSWNPWLQYG